MRVIVTLERMGRRGASETILPATIHGGWLNGIGRVIVVPVIERTEQHLPDVTFPVSVVHNVPLCLSVTDTTQAEKGIDSHANSFETKAAVQPVEPVYACLILSEPDE